MVPPISLQADMDSIPLACHNSGVTRHSRVARSSKDASPYTDLHHQYDDLQHFRIAVVKSQSHGPSIGLLTSINPRGV